jgi:hypothetical protein
MHRILKTLTLAAICLFAVTSQAFAAADITLDRNPAPPQQVPADGTGVVQYEYTLTYDSNPDRAVIRLTGNAPTYTTLQSRFVDMEPDQASPVTVSGSFTIPAGTPAGTYFIMVDYYTDTNFGGCGAVGPNTTPDTPSACVEDQASVNFEVVASPSVILTKFNDLNRDGDQDAGELSLSGWIFDATGPLGPVPGGPFTTDNTGRIILSGLTPGAAYTFTEHVQSGWQVIGGNVSQTVTIPPGGTALVNFANALIDECSNIAGNQAAVPAGMFQVGSTCVVDQCANIAGGQSSVPSGYNQDGVTCTPIVYGKARMVSKSGCVKGKFLTRVRGTQIARVVFYVDGRRVKTVYGSSAQIKLNTYSYRVGVHKIRAVVTFRADSHTAAKTLKSTFFRCAAPKPAFTG